MENERRGPCFAGRLARPIFWLAFLIWRALALLQKHKALSKAALSEPRLAPRQAGVVLLTVSLCSELSCRDIVEAKLTVL
jgi:hypothetical protein